MIDSPLDTPQKAVFDSLRSQRRRFAHRQSETPSAFTLIELLVVVAIIAILAGLALSAMGGVQKKASRDRAKAEVSALVNALESYRSQFGEYPEANGKKVPYTNISHFLESFSGQIRNSDEVVDPFGNAYVYEYPGKTNPASFDLYSTGGESDDANNTAKRIGNW